MKPFEDKYAWLYFIHAYSLPNQIILKTLKEPTYGYF
jgi:hypothetical protein